MLLCSMLWTAGTFLALLPPVRLFMLIWKFSLESFVIRHVHGLSIWCSVRISFRIPASPSQPPRLLSEDDCFRVPQPAAQAATQMLQPTSNPPAPWASICLTVGLRQAMRGKTCQVVVSYLCSCAMYSFHFSLAKLLSHAPGVHCLKVGCPAANSAKAESSLHKPCSLPARESLQAPAPERKKIACQKEEEHQIFVKYQVYLETTSVGVFNDNLRPSSKKPPTLQTCSAWSHGSNGLNSIESARKWNQTVVYIINILFPNFLSLILTWSYPFVLTSPFQNFLLPDFEKQQAIPTLFQFYYFNLFSLCQSFLQIGDHSDLLRSYSAFF